MPQTKLSDPLTLKSGRDLKRLKLALFSKNALLPALEHASTTVIRQGWAVPLYILCYAQKDVEKKQQHMAYALGTRVVH